MYSSFSFLLIPNRTDVSEEFLRSTPKLKQLADFLFDGHKREKIGHLFFSFKAKESYRSLYFLALLHAENMSDRSLPVQFAIRKRDRDSFQRPSTCSKA